MNADSTGVRDAQRALGVSSPSTISWHLDELEVAKLIQQLPSNRYILTELGKNYNDFQIPVNHTIYYIKGLFLPSLIFVLSFLTFGLISTLLLYIIDAGRTAIFLNAFFDILIAIILTIIEFVQIQRQITRFSTIKPKV